MGGTRFGRVPAEYGWWCTVSDAGYREGFFLADEDKGAEQAKAQLRRGIARSKVIVSDYRRMLLKLRKLDAKGPAERPLFRFGRD